MTANLSEKIFVWFTVTLEIQLESYGLRLASVVFWYTTLYAYTSSLYIHRYLVRNYAWQQKSRTLWLLRAKGGFIAKDASFYHNKVAQLHDMLQFQLIVYAIIRL